MNTTIEDKDGIMTVAFEGLEYISSSGLRVFLSIALDTQSAGKHVSITGLSDLVREVFDTTGFTNLFEIK